MDFSIERLPGEGSTFAPLIISQKPITNLEKIPGLNILIETGVKQDFRLWMYSRSNQAVADALGISRSHATRLARNLGVNRKPQTGQSRTTQWRRRQEQAGGEPDTGDDW